jgi:hypothetical protein
MDESVTIFPFAGRRGFFQRTALDAGEFVHFGLTAKYQLTTTLGRRGDRGGPDESGWVRDSLIWPQENNLSPPASPYPLPSERAVVNCDPAVNPNTKDHEGS